MNTFTDMRLIDEKLDKLGQSRFRARFRLGAKYRDYVRDKGMDTIRKHAVDFITTRIAPANPNNDGRQTPMKNHPVFIAQHATGTCCRKCLEKWHGIPKGLPLTTEHIDYTVTLIMTWMARQMDDT